MRFCNLDYIVIMAKSILSLIPGVALAFSTTAILNIYVLPILHYTCKSSSLLHSDMGVVERPDKP